MEILFRDEYDAYIIIDGYMSKRDLMHYDNSVINNIKHLDDAKILYHYRAIANDLSIPVYYEYNKRFISKGKHDYLIFHIGDFSSKDYTLVNLKLLEDGNII